MEKSFVYGVPLLTIILLVSEMKQLYLTDPVFGIWFRKRFAI